MLLSVNDMMNRIVERLNEYFSYNSEAGCSYRKPAGNSGDFDESTPHVYAFLCPPSKMNVICENMPNELPSVTVVLNSHYSDNDNRDYTLCDFTIYCCTYNPSEKVAFERIKDSENFEKTDDNNYNLDASNFELDLYKSCVDLQASVIQCMRQQTDFSFEDEPRVSSPSAALEDFPAIVGTIEMTVRLYDYAIRYNNNVSNLL